MFLYMFYLSSNYLPANLAPEDCVTVLGRVLLDPQKDGVAPIHKRNGPKKLTLTITQYQQSWWSSQGAENPCADASVVENQ